MLGCTEAGTGICRRKMYSSSSTVEPAPCQLQQPIQFLSSRSSIRFKAARVNVSLRAPTCSVHKQQQRSSTNTSCRRQQLQHRCPQRPAVWPYRNQGFHQAADGNAVNNGRMGRSSSAGAAAGPSADTGGNAGDSSGGTTGGGGNRPPQSSTTASDNDDSSDRTSMPRNGILVLTGLGLLILYFVVRACKQRLLATPASNESSSEGLGLSIKDSIAAVKRLLRELFADQLNLKQRLDTLETAAAQTLEAADDYELDLGSSGSSRYIWSRSPVRVSGSIAAAGVLPWSQESSAAHVLSVLRALGASGQADARLMLHSVLGAGKRRATAEFSQTPAVGGNGGMPLLQLNKLLYRVQIKKWFHLMIAPLGGSLDAVARSLTPIHADYGCTHALRRGHGLSVFEHTGSGKAAVVTRGGLSAAAGHFVGGTSKTTSAQLQLQSSNGYSLSLVAAHCRPRHKSSDNSSSSSSQQTGMRFLGVQAPQTVVQHGPSSSEGRDLAGTVLGAVGVVPIKNSFTATAWAEKPQAGTAGWGLGLYSQPDPDGVEMGMVLGRPSSNYTAFRTGVVPLFCELSAKVPVGDGLSISPGALVLYGPTSKKATLAYLMQSCWRF